MKEFSVALNVTVSIADLHTMEDFVMEYTDPSVIEQELEGIEDSNLEEAYHSFPSAKHSLAINNLEIVFDRITLFLYSHNLSRDKSIDLRNHIDSIFNDTKSAEEKKLRREYLVLLDYLWKSQLWCGAEFRKETRPDFILQIQGSNNTIGVEITEFKTKAIGELLSISSVNFGKGKTIGDIKETAIIRFKNSADKFIFSEIDGFACISTGLIDTVENQKHYSETISKKYEKYKDFLDQFDKFVLVCDARLTSALSCVSDAKQVLEFVRLSNPAICNFNVHILYNGKDTKKTLLYKGHF